MMPRNLFELAVTVQSAEDIDDPNHCEITVEPAVNGSNTDEFFSKDDDEALISESLLGAGLHHAGILGRLFTALTPWIDHERATHGCGHGALVIGYKDEPMWFEACYIGAWGVLTPTDEECFQPRLYLIVPVKQERAWLDRIRLGLDAIAQVGA